MIENLIAATYAPMNETGALNTTRIEAYSRFLVRNKVSGVFMNGSTGDFTSLSIEERKQITLAWAKQKSTELYLIDHVGDPSLKVAKELAEYASDKVDAISALAPFYFKIKHIDKLIEYCKEISASAPNLPFYYYHIPVLSGADLDMKIFLEEGIKEIPNLAGIKFSSDNLVDYKYCKDFNKNCTIFFGVDELFVKSLPLGGRAWVGSTYNHLAPLYLKIRSLFNEGNAAAAEDLQEKAVQFVKRLDSKGGFNGVAKGFMKILGVDCGPSRFPHTTLSDTEYSQIKKELDSIGLKEFFCV